MVFFISSLLSLRIESEKKGKEEEGGKESSRQLTSQRPTCIPFDQTTPAHEEMVVLFDIDT
jgi:hypothetical protein